MKKKMNEYKQQQATISVISRTSETGYKMRYLENEKKRNKVKILVY